MEQVDNSTTCEELAILEAAHEINTLFGYPPEIAKSWVPFILKTVMSIDHARTQDAEERRERSQDPAST